MRIVEQTCDRLVLQQGPTAYHIAAFIVFGLAGFAVIFTVAGATTPKPPLNVWAGVAITAALLVASVLIWLFAPTTWITFDRPAGSLRIERRGYLAHSEQSEPLTKVKAAELEEDTMREFGTGFGKVYRVVVRLSGGRIVPLSPFFDNFDLPGKQAVIAAIHAFLERRGDTTVKAGS